MGEVGREGGEQSSAAQEGRPLIQGLCAEVRQLGACHLHLFWSSEGGMRQPVVLSRGAWHLSDHLPARKVQTMDSAPLQRFPL